MKILCIFLIFIFTISCGPSVLQRKTREKTRGTEERKRQCYLVRGACKTSCNSWEYVFTDCDSEPCCVVREYIMPVKPSTTTKASITVNYTPATLRNTTDASYVSSTLRNTNDANYNSTTLSNTTDVNYNSTI
ncbi:beta-defensin 113 [Eschrichtius robustus]|uniref:beta-defensin 113 n=1 Tax=Eschrichtius robustus TaxID=9764 RepID=UPI0035C03021